MGSRAVGAAARLLFALVLILGGVRPAAAQNAVITGFVVDNVGGRVPAATITATSGPTEGAVTTSAADGSYRLANLAPGSYVFTATKSGYTSQNRGQTLAAGDNRRLDFTLASETPLGGVLQGSVIRSDTRDPLSGVTVQLTGGAGTVPQTQITGADGAFRFENLTSGVYRLSVDRDGFFSYSRNFTVTVNRVTTANVSLRLRAAELSTLQGTVEDSTGRRVSNVTLTLTGGETRATLRSARSGTYRITRVVPGDYVLQVRAAGFADQDIPVTLTAGQSTTLNIVLVALGAANSTIQGFTVDNFGDPIVGARVQITAGPLSNRFDLSDNTGFYQITGLPAGTYTLRATASGHDNDVQVATVAQDATARVDFRLTANPALQVGAIAGRVTNTSGTGLANVVVQVTAGPTTGTSVATDDEGDYSLGNLDPGTYAVTFSRSGFTTRTITSIDVAARRTTTLDVELTASGQAGSITGVVTDADTDAVLSGVTVRLLQGATTVDTATTSAGGSYTFTGVPPGSYSVRFSKTGYSTLTRAVTVSASSTTTANAALSSDNGGGGEGNSSLRVRVNTSTGRPIQSATVEISGPASRSGNTDEEGQITFTDLPAGTYSVVASAAGMNSSTGQATVTEGGSASVALGLVPDGTAGIIAGAVYNSSGLPIPAVITLVNGPVVGISRNTSSNGSFTFTGLPAGAYSLQVRSPGYRTRVVNLFVRAGSTSTTSVFLYR